MKNDDEYNVSTVDSTLQCNSPTVKEETDRCVGKDTVDTPKTKNSELFDTPLNDIVLHRNYNCWQNTPGVHIQRALYDNKEPFEREASAWLPRLSCSSSWRQLAIATRSCYGHHMVLWRCCLSDKMNTRGSKMLDGDVSFSKDGVRPLRFQVGEIIVHGQVCACTSMRVGLRMRSFVLA